MEGEDELWKDIPRSFSFDFRIGLDGNFQFVGYNVRATGHVERLMKELGVES